MDDDETRIRDQVVGASVVVGIIGSLAWTGNPLDIDGPPLTDIWAVLGSALAVLSQSFDFFLAAGLIGVVFFSVVLGGLEIWDDRGR